MFPVESDSGIVFAGAALLRPAVDNVETFAVIPWLGPEFSGRKRLKSTPGHNPVCNSEIRFDFPYMMMMNTFIKRTLK